MKSPGSLLEDSRYYYEDEGRWFWELLFGEIQFIGGLKSLLNLARTAQLHQDMKGVFIGSGNGAGACALAKHFDVFVTGIVFSEKQVSESRQLALREGLADVVTFLVPENDEIPVESNSMDFVIGKDTWCYSDNKNEIIDEAARMLRPGGKLAFTDIVKGRNELTDPEIERVNSFLKTHRFESFDNYKRIILSNGLSLIEMVNLGREFSELIYAVSKMFTNQLTYDALKLYDFNSKTLENIECELENFNKMILEGKLSQGMFTAFK